MKKILTNEQVGRAIERLNKAVLAKVPHGPRIAVVGIRSRGETLARRLVKRLRDERPDLSVDFGILDITFYRDDLSRQRGAPLVRATEIDFDLDDVWLLLVDDVLQTGRSVRAALDALHDFGRPQCIRLAILIDRGGRELPIAADFVGRTMRAHAGVRVQLRLKETDGQEGVYIVKKEA